MASGFDAEKKAEILYKDFQVAVVEVPKQSDPSAEEANVKRSPRSGRFLAQQLADLVRSSTLCDLVITDGQKNYNIHRVVLTAQSPKYAGVYLEAKETNDSGNVPTEIKLAGIAKLDVLPEILEYMYTGEYLFSDATLDETMNAALTLDLPKLKDLCVSYLANYSVSNALEYLVIATKYHVEEMKRVLAAYVGKYASILVTTPKFLEISVDVLCCILDLLNKEEHDVDILQLVFKWLSADRDHRKVHFLKILEKANLKNLTPETLSEHVKNHADLFELDEYIDVILNAYKYHALSRANGGTK